MTTGPGCLHVGAPAGLDPELVADRAWSLGATAIGQVAGGRLEIGFVSVEAAEAAAGALGEWWPDLEVVVVDAAPALEAALESWRPFARPFRVGRLHIRPSFLPPDDDPPAAGEWPVVVDPTLAFGYDHPSTRLCLEQVERSAGPGVSVLDVGCGSGILAIAAAVLGAGPVRAVDVDPVAVAAAQRAAAQHHVTLDVSEGSVESIGGTFDLVVANIGAGALVAMAPALTARVAGGGTLVLAGLLVEQVDAVVAAYAKEGLVPGPVTTTTGWAAPIFLGFPAEIPHPDRSVQHTVDPQLPQPPTHQGSTREPT